jgi:hypothetical protein
MHVHPIDDIVKSCAPDIMSSYYTKQMLHPYVGCDVLFIQWDNKIG